ncbi:CBS domain-containing protein, partial [Halioglobus sp. HI00S01]
VDITTTSMGELMHRNPKTAAPGILAAEAMKTMEESEITSLIITDYNSREIRGVLHLMHLLHAGIA